MLPLPTSLNHLKEHQWSAISEGESDATVYRLTDPAGIVRYLKVSSHTAQYSVRQDHERLQWLQGKLPAPRPLHYEETTTHQYLLMSDCHGLHPLHDDLPWDAVTRVRLLAEAARACHTLEIADCPYRMTFNDQIALARHNIEQGLVRVDMWDDENQGRTITSLYEEFVSLKPDVEDYVVTHGDLYPINIRVDAATQRITGFIDVGALAVADRYTDFAAIINAIGWHLDPIWQTRFFEAYGIFPDLQKLRFYQLFQEFI